jgi:hypothetical protein
MARPHSERRYLLAAVLWLAIARHGLAQTITTSVTTIVAPICETPSCTVSLAAVTSLTVTPSATTVHVPGKVDPLTFAFDPVTLQSFQPDPTTLSNPGTGILSLGSITITNLPSASATQSYKVDGDEDVTLTAAVTVAVEAKAQLFVAEEIDDSSTCALFPGQTRRDVLQSFEMSRIVGQRPNITKREEVFSFIDPTIRTFAVLAVTDALTMVQTFLTYFQGTVTVKAKDVPDTVG